MFDTDGGKSMRKRIAMVLLGLSLAVGTPAATIMRCDSDSGKKLIKSMVLRTADRQGMC